MNFRNLILASLFAFVFIGKASADTVVQIMPGQQARVGNVVVACTASAQPTQPSYPHPHPPSTPSQYDIYHCDDSYLRPMLKKTVFNLDNEMIKSASTVGEFQTMEECFSDLRYRQGWVPRSLSFSCTCEYHLKTYGSSYFIQKKIFGSDGPVAAITMRTDIDDNEQICKGKLALYLRLDPTCN